MMGKTECSAKNQDFVFFLNGLLCTHIFPHPFWASARCKLTSWKVLVWCLFNVYPPTDCRDRNSHVQFCVRFGQLANALGSVDAKQVLMASMEILMLIFTTQHFLSNFWYLVRSEVSFFSDVQLLGRSGNVFIFVRVFHGSARGTALRDAQSGEIPKSDRSLLDAFGRGPRQAALDCGGRLAVFGVDVSGLCPFNTSSPTAACYRLADIHRCPASREAQYGTDRLFCT